MAIRSAAMAVKRYAVEAATFATKVRHLADLKTNFGLVWFSVVLVPRLVEEEFKMPLAALHVPENHFLSSQTIYLETK